jgi:hypothetical protein
VSWDVVIIRLNTEISGSTDDLSISVLEIDGKKQPRYRSKIDHPISLLD